MTNRIIHSYAHGVLDIDAAEECRPGLEAAFAPGRELLDPARAGWERFLDSFEEPSVG
ncbi:hypothetical protein [Streptomyces lavendulae]|uniref:hypothetical protein n=1 Tax=Streptomyces lavendulae TaxID=1914 RepID=UPI0033EC3687